MSFIRDNNLSYALKNTTMLTMLETWSFFTEENTRTVKPTTGGFILKWKRYQLNMWKENCHQWSKRKTVNLIEAKLI